jgi:hypothetical protein
MTAASRTCEDQARTALGEQPYHQHYMTGFAARSVRDGVRQILDVLPGPASDHDTGQGIAAE